MRFFYVSWFVLLCCGLALAQSEQSEEDQQSKDKNEPSSHEYCKCYNHSDFRIHDDLEKLLKDRIFKAEIKSLISYATNPYVHKFIVGLFKKLSPRLQMITQVDNWKHYIILRMSREHINTERLELLQKLEQNLGSNETQEGQLKWEEMLPYIKEAMMKQMKKFATQLTVSKSGPYNPDPVSMWCSGMNKLATEWNIAKGMNTILSNHEANKQLDIYLGKCSSDWFNLTEIQCWLNNRTEEETLDTPIQWLKHWENDVLFASHTNATAESKPSNSSGDSSSTVESGYTGSDSDSDSGSTSTSESKPSNTSGDSSSTVESGSTGSDSDSDSSSTSSSESEPSNSSGDSSRTVESGSTGSDSDLDSSSSSSSESDTEEEEGD